MVAALLGEKGRKRRKMWMHKMCLSRPLEGEFATLFAHLENDQEKFHRYFRMSAEKFEELLSIITPVIQRQNSTFRLAVSPKERLAVCLKGK